MNETRTRKWALVLAFVFSKAPRSSSFITFIFLCSDKKVHVIFVFFSPFLIGRKADDSVVGNGGIRRIKLRWLHSLVIFLFFRSACTLQHTCGLESSLVQQSRRAAKSERCERQQHCFQRHGTIGRHRLSSLQSTQFSREDRFRCRGKKDNYNYTKALAGKRENLRETNDCQQIEWQSKRSSRNQLFSQEWSLWDFWARCVCFDILIFLCIIKKSVMRKIYVDVCRVIMTVTKLMRYNVATI